ncbi:MAG: methyl-accepting chemotaxis protein [Symbiobacteriia bacterium]
MRISLATKLMVSYLVMVLLLGLVAFVGISSSSKTESQYADLVDRRDKISFAVADIGRQVDASWRDLGWYALSGSQADHEHLAVAGQRTDADLKLLRSIVGKAQGGTGGIYLDKIQQTSDAYWQVVTQDMAEFKSARDSGQILTADQTLAIAADGKANRDALNKAISDMLDYQITSSKAARDHATSDQDRSTWEIVGVAVVAALLAVGLGILLSGSISRPVRAITTAAQQMARGDLRIKDVKVRTRDEVEDLGIAFNQMTANVRNLIAEIVQAAEDVAASADQLREASGQTASASQQVAQAMGGLASGASEQSQGSVRAAQITSELKQAISQVAAGAQEQSRHIQTTAVTADKLSRDLDDLVAIVERIRQASTQNGDSAREGLDVVNRTVGGMERIRQAVGDATGRLKELDVASNQISQITQVITDIADQTNLLALNAAIEAARAGEHGKGFAVVAEEVRKLAERSASSAREITALVTGIQTGTRNVVEAMGRSNSEVESGTDLAHQAGRVLESVVTTVDKTVAATGDAARVATENAAAATESTRSVNSVAAIVEENTAATEEMTASADQVEDIVGTVARVAEDNAAAVEEVSASVEEMSASVEEIAASAENLKGIAGGLRQAVSRFTI